MKPIEPRTAQEKAVRIVGGLVIVVIGMLIASAGGAIDSLIGILGLIVGLSLAGNAVFAKTKK